MPSAELDRDTTGLLLLTDNGPLGFQLLHPQYHVNKTYQVEVNGLLTHAHIQAFQKGIVFLDGTICKPARLEILSASPSLSQASITISEGKFHQVKENVPLSGCQSDLPQTHPFWALEFG